jgi:hypothetical protein
VGAERVALRVYFADDVWVGGCQLSEHEERRLRAFRRKCGKDGSRGLRRWTIIEG